MERKDFRSAIREVKKNLVNKVEDIYSRNFPAARVRRKEDDVEIKSNFPPPQQLPNQPEMVILHHMKSLRNLYGKSEILDDIY